MQTWPAFKAFPQAKLETTWEADTEASMIAGLLPPNSSVSGVRCRRRRLDDFAAGLGSTSKENVVKGKPRQMGSFFRATENHLDPVFWKGRPQPIRHHLSGAWCLFGRLHHHSVSRSQRGDHRFHGQQQGEIPWRDDQHDPLGLVQDL